MLCKIVKANQERVQLLDISLDWLIPVPTVHTPVYMGFRSSILSASRQDRKTACIAAMMSRKRTLLLLVEEAGSSRALQTFDSQINNIIARLSRDVSKVFLPFADHYNCRARVTASRFYS